MLRSECRTVGQRLDTGEAPLLESLLLAIKPTQPLLSPLEEPMMSLRCRYLLSLSLLSFVIWTHPVGAQPVLVKDINLFPQSSEPSGFAAIGNVVYFTAHNHGHGSELWRSNGTAAGTVLVKDIWPGGRGSDPSDFTNINGVLYFAADNGANGREVWRFPPP